MSENQPLVLHGEFVKHPKYGRQFEVTSIELDRQMDARGLANYLANNPDIKGIGPAKAKIIAERFVSDFERSLIDEPEKIAEAAKVPLPVIESLRVHWLETSHINQAMTALSAYGLTHHQVTKLVKKLGNNAVGIIEHDPYVIVGEIDGFGFKRIDKIARQVGIDKDNLPVAKPRASCSDKERHAFAGHDSPAFLEIASEQCAERRLQELDLRNATFAGDTDVFAVEVDVIDIETHQFRNANAGAEEQLDDDPVAAGQWIREQCGERLTRPELQGCESHWLLEQPRWHLYLAGE